MRIDDKKRPASCSDGVGRDDRAAARRLRREGISGDGACHTAAEQPLRRSPQPEKSPLATPVDTAPAATPASTAAEKSEAAAPEIIAESSNTVSDKEKQQILDELSSELDQAIETLNGLDEPDDSDMSADSIE